MSVAKIFKVNDFEDFFGAEGKHLAIILSDKEKTLKIYKTLKILKFTTAHESLIIKCFQTKKIAQFCDVLQLISSNET